MDIAFTYDEEKAPIVGYKDGKPERGVLDGVPMRDLTTDEFTALPERLQKAVVTCGYFIPTPAVALPDEPEPKKKK